MWRRTAAILELAGPALGGLAESSAPVRAGQEGMVAVLRTVVEAAGLVGIPQPVGVVEILIYKTEIAVPAAVAAAGRRVCRGAILAAAAAGLD